VRYNGVKEKISMIIMTEIPSFSSEDKVTDCCPIFHPEKWDKMIYDFSAYSFIKAQSKSFMYVPVNLDKVMTKVQKDIDEAKAAYSDRYLILSQDISAFKCDHYFLVKGPVSKYPSQKVEGRYYCRVQDGDFRNISTWMKDFDEELHQKDRSLKEVFLFYTTCPKCAKVYGHNYVVLLAKVDNDFEL
jgi:hypothetical protein